MKLRYERKYLVPKENLVAIRNRIQPFVLPDNFAENIEWPEYTVRSIYLDSPEKSALYEKEDGVEVRRKLRIRGYNNLQDSSEVFLEIKRKYGNRIGKNRVLIPYQNLSKLLEWGPDEALLAGIDEQQQEDLMKFFYYTRKQFQSPVNLIVYDREPYHGKFDPSVRITFDKNIRSRLNPNFAELFNDSDFVHIWKEYFILEIKYNEAPMPIWAKSIVEEFKLQSQALSKYVEGYYCHQLN